MIADYFFTALLVLVCTALSLMGILGTFALYTAGEDLPMIFCALFTFCFTGLWIAMAFDK